MALTRGQFQDAKASLCHRGVGFQNLLRGGGKESICLREAKSHNAADYTRVKRNAEVNEEGEPRSPLPVPSPPAALPVGALGSSAPC